jgi:hypothetical protein
VSKIVQLNRMDREDADRFIGAVGEITVDESNQDLRLHDGVTPGGRVIANRDNNDVIYQARSPELDGLLGFEPQNRGFLVRRGPADYRLRTLTVNGNQLTLNNSTGYAGNPLLGLADTITTDHIFSGNITFEEEVNASGGVRGNLLGNSAGLHIGNVIGNLTGDSAGTHTGQQIGPVDVRGEALLLDAGQIHLAALNADVVDFIVQWGTPPGMIAPFAGLIADIPDTWFLCDGSNATPDLRNSFVVGAGVTYDVGDQGGAVNHTHAVTGDAHTHTITIADHVLVESEIPSHRHSSGIGDNNAGEIDIYGSVASPGTGTPYGIVAKNDGRGVHNPLTSLTGGGGGHAHAAGAAPTASTGATDSVSNLPPYFALAYIMKGF